MVNILTRAIMMSTPLLLGALAEVYAERTGMMICAIEGIFLIGAWGGFVGTYLSGSLLVGLLLARRGAQQSRRHIGDGIGHVVLHVFRKTLFHFRFSRFRRGPHAGAKGGRGKQKHG